MTRISTTPVAVLATDADALVAEKIRTYLGENGIRSIEETTKAEHSTVVLLSADSVRDRAFLARVDGVGPTRLVPVAMGAVPTANLPEVLCTINWILWDPNDPQRACANILSATQTDLDHYRIARSVEAKAHAWESGGRNKFELLVSRGELREAIADSAALQPDTGGDQDPVIGDFLSASRLHVRKLTWKHRRRLAVWTVMTVVLVFVGGFFFISKRDAIQTQQLQYIAHGPSTDRRPDVQAIKMAALLVHEVAIGKGLDPGLVNGLADDLSEPWPMALLGEESPKSLNALAFDDDPSRIWGADGGGEVAAWSLKAGTRGPARKAGVLLSQVAVTPDGHTIATSDGTKVRVLHDGRATTTVTAKSSVQDLVLSRNGSWLAYHAGDQVFSIDLSGVTLTPKPSPKYDRVLDLQATTGGILALVRQGDHVAVVDVVDGHERWRSTEPTSELEKGAVAPNGGVALSSPSGQVLWSGGRAPLMATGQYTPDLLTAIAVTSDGLVLYSANAIGTRGYDAKVGVRIPDVCRELATVVRLTLSPDEKRLSCDGQGMHSIWSLEGLRPQGPAKRAPGSAGRGAAVSETESGEGMVSVHGAKGFIVSASVTPEGYLKLESRKGLTGPAERRLLIDVTGASVRSGDKLPVLLPGTIHSDAPPSFLAIAPNGSTLAVGSADGSLTELDVIGTHTIIRAHRWVAPDRAAIRSVVYEGRELVVTTDSAVWRVPSCAGCGATPLALVAIVMRRQLPCYPADLTKIVPAEDLKLMKVRLCAAPGGTSK